MTDERPGWPEPHLWDLQQVAAMARRLETVESDQRLMNAALIRVTERLDMHVQECQRGNQEAKEARSALSAKVDAIANKLDAFRDSMMATGNSRMTMILQWGLGIAGGALLGFLLNPPWGR